MHILLPVAGVSISLWSIIGVGVIVGFLSGLVGVGGGFLMTPIMMTIGVPPTVAAASDTNSVIATSSSGMAAHFKLGNVDLKLGCVLSLGGLTGAQIGVRIIKLLRSMGNADLAICITYVVVLGTVGAYMFYESLQTLRRGSIQPSAVSHTATSPSFLRRLPFQMSFPRSHVQHSVIVPFLLCMVVGILAAIMGVGGGFIMIPMMVYLLRMPMHIAVGTSLFQILFTGAGLTLMQAVTNHTVDLVLALLVAIGSTVGAQLGARMAKILRGEQLRIVLATVVLIVTIKMAVGLGMTPSTLLSYARGH